MVIHTYSNIHYKKFQSRIEHEVTRLKIAHGQNNISNSQFTASTIDIILYIKNQLEANNNIMAQLNIIINTL